MRIPSGITDQYIYFVAVDDTDLATRETGLSTFTVTRSRNGATSVNFTSPTVTEVDSSNMPGVYQLLLDEDMTIGSNNLSEEVALHITHAGMAPVTRIYELYDGQFVTNITTLDTNLSDLMGAGFDTSTDSNEAIRNRGDSNWTGSPPTSNSGTAQAGAAGTITLAAGASATDNLYNGQLVYITGGTGAGQSITITSYVGSTKVATVGGTWVVTPDNTSTYDVYPADVDVITVPSVIEIADAVWDEPTTSHDTLGTFGERVSVDVPAILVDTSNIQPKLGSFDVDLATDLGVVDTNVDAILVDTGTTIPATLSTIDGKVDTVDSNVDAVLVDTGTSLPADIAGVSAQVSGLNDVTAADFLTTQLTESYAADGVAPTVEQALLAIQQRMIDADVSGTTLTVRQLDGTSVAFVITLDDANDPTDMNRTS